MWRLRGVTPENKNAHACKALGYGLAALYGTARPLRNENPEDDVVTYLTPLRKRRSENTNALLGRRERIVLPGGGVKFVEVQAS